jgi:integrase
MIHRAFADAVAWRYLEYNPAEHAALPRESRKGTRKPGTTWTPEELAVWLTIALDDRDAGIWVLASTTGMRRSELAGADRDLLDLDGATLGIADTRVVVDSKADESDGKTEKRPTGDLTGPAHRLLPASTRRHAGCWTGGVRHRLPQLGKARLPPGRPVHPDTITGWFSRLVDRARVKRIRLHVRHTHATLSLDAGVDPEIVADRIGRQQGIHAGHLHAPVDREGPGSSREGSRDASRGRVDLRKVQHSLHWHPTRQRAVRSVCHTARLVVRKHPGFLGFPGLAYLSQRARARTCA